MKKQSIFVLFLFTFFTLSSVFAHSISSEDTPPPTFDFDDFCENESGFPSNINPLGGTFSFAPDPGDGSMINATTGEVTNAVGGSTYSIEYTVGGNSSIEQVTINPIPTYTIISHMCDPGNMTWTLTFTSDADQVSANFPTVPVAGVYTASNIPLSMTLSMTLTINSTQCEINVDIMPPVPCVCTVVPDPPTPGDTAYLCEGSAAPIISASADPGMEIDWYDAATFGNLLASATNTYQTSAAGVYYAEARDPGTGCVSDRVPVVVIFVPTATFDTSGVTCLVTGDVEFNIVFPGEEADSITTSIGNVINNNDGTFSVTDVPWGTTVTINTFYFSTGCSWSDVITLPMCCHLLDPPISLGDTTVCHMNPPFPSLSVEVPPGYSANWYTGMTSTPPIATSTTTYTPTTIGDYYVSTFDPVSGCESTTRTRIVLAFQPPPIYNFQSDSCNTATELYAFTFVSTPDTILLSDGTLTNNHPTYEVSDLVGGSNFTMTLISSAGCETEVSFVVPICTCPIVDPPVTGGDVTYCVGDPIPSLSASVPAGTTIDWYDVMTGGTPILSGSTTFTPTAPGTYYAEARETNLNCVSDTRTAIMLSELPLPTFILDSVPCVLVTTYNIYFTTDAAVITSNQGTVTNIMNDHYVISGSAVGSTTSITLESANGCVLDTLIQSPICLCPPLNPPTSLGDTTVCEGTSPFPALSVSVPPGLTANWYTAPSGGTSVATSTTSYTPLTPGTYWVTTFDPLTGCESNARTPIVLAIDQPPTFVFNTDSCNTSTELYSFSFLANSFAIVISQGTLTLVGSYYEVSDLVGGANFSMSLISQHDCSWDTTFIVPSCTCPMIDPPVSGGDLTFCTGDPLPALSASVPTGFEIDWYDMMSGGSPILTGSGTFTPAAPGTYYAEAREISSNCVSDTRTPILLTELPLPTFALDSLPCVQTTTYSIFMTTDAAIVTSNQGTVSSVINEHYEVANCLVGTTTLVTLESADGCTLDTLIQSPMCNCPTIAPPISAGDTTICEGAPIPFLEVFVDIGYTVNWYSQAVGGTPIATSSTTYTPLVAGTYYASTVDPGSMCESQVRMPVTLTIENLPFINVISDSCNSNTQLYSFSFMTNAVGIAPNSGSLTSVGATIYEISDLVSGSTFSMTLTTLFGCTNDTMFIVPACGCPPINPPSITADTFYCEGTTIPLLEAQTNSTFQIDWYDALTGGNLLLSNSATYQPTGPGPYFAEVFDSMSGCASLRSMVIVDEASRPSFELDSIFCVDTSFYSVRFISDASSIAFDLGMASSPDTNTYEIIAIPSGFPIEISVFSAEQCSIDSIISAPDCGCPSILAPVSMGDTSFCENGIVPSVIATSPEGHHVNWFDAVNGGTLIQSGSDTLLPPGAGIYYAEAIDSLSGCKSQMRTAINVAALPLPTFVLDSMVCRPDLAGFSLYFQTNATQINSSLDVSIIFNGSQYVVDSLGSGTSISFGLIDSNGCQIDTTILGLVCDCPMIDAPVSAGDEMYCEGSSTIPTLNVIMGSGLSYDWYDSASGGNLLFEDTTTILLDRAGLIYVEAIDRSTGCSSMTRTLIELIELPLPSFTLDSINCQHVGFYEIYFHSDGSPMTSIGNLQTIGLDAYHVDSIPSSIDIELTISSTFCSLDTTITAQICDCPMIDPPRLSSDTTICFGSPLPVLTASATNGHSINWYNAAVAGTLLLEGSTTYHPTAIGTYFAEAVDDQTGCVSALRSSVTITEAAAITLNLPMDQTSCLLAGRLEAVTNAANVEWRSLDSAVLMNNMGTSVDYNLPTFGSYQFEVEAISQGCSSIDTIQITANEFAVNVDSRPPTCLDTLGVITIDGTLNEGPYSLIENNNPVVMIDEFPYILERSSGDYQFVIENNDGCSQVFDINVPQVAPLFLDLGPDIEGETAQQFTINIQTNFDPFIYEWNSTDGLSDFNSLTPQLVLDETTTYFLTATDTNGCSVSDSIAVNVINSFNVFIPNAFSPNNDGINDLFLLYSNGDPLLEQFQIFNRWGGIVFERAGVNLSQIEGWSGYQNGKLASSGVYIYSAKLLFADGSTRYYSGELTLAR